MRGLMFYINNPAAVLVFVLAGFCSVTDGASIPAANESSKESVGYKIHKETIEETFKGMKNCTLYPKFSEEKENIADLVSAGNTQVKIAIEIDGDNGPFTEEYTGHVFRPNNWIIVTSLTGKSMLLLKEYFVEMSIQTFGQGVVKADLKLIQNPIDCLKDRTQEEIENSLRRLFLRNFEPEGTLLLEEAEICNKHVKEINGEGQVIHICCRENAEKVLECSKIHRSTLMKVLSQFITVLKWIAVSCFPLFIPYSIYKDRNLFREFVFEAEDKDDIEFNLLKVSKLPDANSFKEAKLQQCTHMTDFKENIAKDVKEFDTVYKCHVNGIRLSVRNSKIIGKGRAPVSVLSFLNNFFVRCKLRHVIPSGDKCCDAKIYKCPNNDCSGKCKCTWFDCLKYPMDLVVLVVCLLPLVIRLTYYVLFERTFVRDQNGLMERRNLNLHIDKTKFIEYPLTTLLSTDYFYIAIIVYSLIPIEWLIYKVCFPIDLKRKVKFTFRKSVRDMRLTRKSELCSLYIGMSLWPLRTFGIAGIVIFPICFISLCVPLAFEVVPVCNFLGQFVKNFRSKDKMNKVKQIMHGISQVVVFWTLFMLLVLIMECISFYVEWIIYVLIGFILNPRVSLRYASMIVLVAVYGHECFSGVHNRYASYNNAIDSKVLEMVGERIKEEASLSETEQVNTVFTVPYKPKYVRKNEKVPFKATEKANKSNTLFSCVKEKTKPGENVKIFELGSEGYLKWRAPRLIIFLDKSDMTYIPKSFLFKMADLPHYLCPGPVHLLYLKAVTDFSLIIIFLVFVFIVISAFGQVQDISTGGQTIAALGSGLLPLFLRRFLFRSHDPPDVDNSDLQWRYMFENAVQTYSEKWIFTDIYVSDIAEVNSNVDAENNLDRGNTGEARADSTDDAQGLQKENEPEGHVSTFELREIHSDSTENEPENQAEHEAERESLLQASKNVPTIHLVIFEKEELVTNTKSLQWFVPCDPLATDGNDNDDKCPVFCNLPCSI